MTQSNPAHNAALQIIQQAVTILANWAKVQLPPGYTDTNSVNKILQSNNQSQIQPLRLLFDSVTLKKNQQQQVHYWEAKKISDCRRQGFAHRNPKIYYPQSEEPDLKELRGEVAQALQQINDKDWQNLPLLMLILEKFGSYISYDENDIALVDIARSRAAVAAALAQCPNAKEISLIAGDLSGIQKFIYTISSDGALKSLRARSFYLELVTEELVQQLLEELQLPRTNIIYAGGGNLYILASHDLNLVDTAVSKVRQQFNRWLRNTFNGSLFLALDYLSVPTEAIRNQDFANYWSNVTTKNLTQQKSQKFASDIKDFIKATPSYEPCRICHRDDLPSLKPLIRLNPDSSSACWMCRTMFKLGDNLFDVKAVLRSKRANIKGHLDRIYLPNRYYYFFQEWEQAVVAAKGDEIVFSINDWRIEHYQSKHTLPLLLGNYATRSKEDIESQKQPGFMSAGEMSETAKGISRVGYLRMDVDRLGQIFAQGLKEKKTLPRIAGLSRQISYFFKVYLNSLAEQRLENLPKDTKVKTLTQEPRQNLLFIYAGGDDLFISGAWNEIVEFAFDVYQSFRAYTGYNPDITLSGGISIADAKFPLYQAAEESGHAEDAAKGNGRDSLGLFGQVFKWDEWLGFQDTGIIGTEITHYLQEAEKSTPELMGVLPFVEKLESYQMELNYSRNFVRNLLITAQTQEQFLKKMEERKTKEVIRVQQILKKPEDEKGINNDVMDIRYYLHLPKIAYTLARLPKNVLEDEELRTSLKSPYNAPYFRAIATWIELLNRQ
ncbi:MAG: type III-A CRISPR-associated protein Cas10/Csm1 [Scytonema sp. PMC 1069.18]|nr:type III-A CRISPR-associated protein Cas10/Csm1 [Scytonema sp. PMC 1069.18]MEC4884950.1 type III-A CRISPR-associated protein Cas10/Csm1 [Scytonema sp. PMC 1070.18]